MVYERAHVESVLFCEPVDAAAIKMVINNIVVFPLVVPFGYAVYYLDSHCHWLFSNFEMGCQHIYNQREIIV